MRGRTKKAAAEGNEHGRWGANANWSVDNNGVLTVTGTGALNESQLTNGQKSNVKKIIISEGITSLERSALYNFRNAEEIVLPESLTFMDKAVFEDCRSLLKINIPSGISSISGFLFFWCTSLKEITIPATVTEIGYAAFMNCTSLERIDIPYSVTKIGDNAFRDCEKLTVYGYEGTFAQLFASAVNIPFVQLEGDVDRSLFPDISDNPSNVYFRQVYWAVNKGIIRGQYGTLDPAAYCSRDQFVIMLWRYAGRPKISDGVPYTDIDRANPAYTSLQWTVKEGITTGFSDGTFRPSDTITRKQICKMFWNWAGQPSAGGKDTITDLLPGDPEFTAVMWCYENGIISAEENADGKLTIRPEDTCQRQQAAALLYNFAKNIKGDKI